MAFESLSEKLQNVFKNLRGKGRLTEADVKAALKEVKIALLEADVNFKVVKNFVKSVQERAIGQDVMNGLNPGQMVIKIVNEELVSVMGSETTEIALMPGNQVTVIMMIGLQGAGKTTTAAKIAGKLKMKGRQPLLVACDIYRPAAIKQLEVNGEKQGVEVFSMGTNHSPVDIAKAAIEHAKNNGQNVVILDTAGRLQIDESMMQELVDVKEAAGVTQTFLVGEKLSDLEQFYPDRMASRILGMGDVMSLIEKVEAQVDAEKAKEMEQKLRKASFDLNDYLDQMEQMKSMGGLSKIMEMLPGMGMNLNAKNMPDMDESEKQMEKIQAIIRSMTMKERTNPDIINASRKNRIAKGAGVDVVEVNRLLKQFDQSRKLMKQMPGMMGKQAKKGRFKLPF